jgi:hypothetical protein
MKRNDGWMAHNGNYYVGFLPGRGWLHISVTGPWYYAGTDDDPIENWELTLSIANLHATGWHTVTRLGGITVTAGMHSYLRGLRKAESILEALAPQLVTAALEE